MITEPTAPLPANPPLSSSDLLGARVTREIFMEDGTWMREGDQCLPKSPLRHGLVVKAERDEITVRWDDGKEGKFYPHGVRMEAPNDQAEPRPGKTPKL